MNRTWYTIPRPSSRIPSATSAAPRLPGSRPLPGSVQDCGSLRKSWSIANPKPMSVRGDEDDGKSHARVRQVGFEVESAHPLEMHIEDQALQAPGRVGLEELLRRRERCHAQSRRAQQPPQRLQDRRIVVDDADKRGL